MEGSKEDERDWPEGVWCSLLPRRLGRESVNLWVYEAVTQKRSDFKVWCKECGRSFLFGSAGRGYWERLVKEKKSLFILKGRSFHVSGMVCSFAKEQDQCKEAYF